LKENLERHLIISEVGLLQHILQMRKIVWGPLAVCCAGLV